jgi:hypothetical protein
MRILSRTITVAGLALVGGAALLAVGSLFGRNGESVAVGVLLFTLVALGIALLVPTLGVILGRYLLVPPFLLVYAFLQPLVVA